MSKTSGGVRNAIDGGSGGSSASPSQSTLAKRIQYLVGNVGKSNFRQTVQEIDQLQTTNDVDLVETFLIRHLIIAIDFNQIPLEQSQLAQFQLLSQRMSKLASKPNFASIIRAALDEVKFLAESFIPLFSQSLHLTQPSTMVVALAMARSISVPVKTQGIAFLHQTVPAHIQGQSLEKLNDAVAAALVRFIREDATFPNKAALVKYFQKNYQRVLDADKKPSVANLIEDAGFSCSENSEKLKKLVNDSFSVPLSVQSVAEVVGMIVRSQDGSGIDRNGASGSWKIANLIHVLNDLMGGGSWDLVMSHLDSPKFRVFSIEGCKILVEIYRQATGNSNFYTKILTEAWRSNPSGQWSLLKAWLSSHEEVFILPTSSEIESLVQGIGETWTLSTVNYIRPYLCLPLVNTLLQLSTEKALIYSQVSEVFRNGPLEHAPGTLLLALVKSPIRCPLHDQLIASLLARILPVNSHQNSSLIIQHVWKEDKELVTKSFLEVYNSDPSLLSRILDIALEVQELRGILDSHPLSFFSVDLSSLASLREALDLSRWIDDCIKKYGSPFIDVLLSFTKDRLERQRNASTAADSRPSHVVVAPESFQIFFDRLRGNTSLTRNQREELGRLVASASEPVGFSSDIEEEANRSFQLIYSNKLSIEDAINVLRRYKASAIPREQKIFQCMIRNLFDEYRFFSKYPDPELKITGIMFGSLVQNQLISYMYPHTMPPLSPHMLSPLGIALRYVLEALKSPPNSKLFMFGLMALEQFTSRLSEWPQYCLHLKQIPAIKVSYPRLYMLIESSLGASGGSTDDSGSPPLGFETPPNFRLPANSAAASQQVGLGMSATGGSGSLSVPSNGGSETSAFASAGSPSQEEEVGLTGHTHNIRTLTSANLRFIEPDENVKDTIHFVFNNVSVQNIDQKLREIKKILKPEYFDYLAHYVVVKRVSMEDNFQELYLEFIERVGEKTLSKKILEQTTRSIRALISSDKIRTEVSERSLLKNLANWLGLQTVARDRPLRYLHLPLKVLLLEAYESGKLIAVIPLVGKILSKVTKSKWFKLPNPWTMALVRLLVEFYRLPQLKLPLKFEVEILAGLLEFHISDIVPTELLKSLRPFNGTPLTDFEFVSTENDAEPDHAAAGSTASSKYQLQYVHINPSIPLFNQQPALKKTVYLAINRAIQDVIVPVVERSIVIASVTTRELVMKDFCMEPDENKMLRGAFNMVQSLAGSLASVTSKESLRATMINNLRAALSPENPTPSHVDHAIHTLVQDNLELACGVVQKSAAEACIRPTAEHLLKSVVDRKNHRERTSGNEKFYDLNFVGSVTYAFTNTLPDYLRPKLGGVTPKQMQVYEEFAALNASTPAVPKDKSGQTTGQSPPQAQSPASIQPQPPITQQPAALPSQSSTTNPTRRSTEQLTSSILSLSPPSSAMNVVVDQVAKVVDQFIVELSNAVNLLTNVRSLSEIPQNHPILLLISRIGEIINVASNRQESALYAVQRTLVRLFDDRATPLHREAFLSLLDALVTIAPKIRSKLTEYILFSPDPQKFHHEIVPALLHSKLVNVTEFDQHLAKLLSQHKREAVEFATFFVQNFLMKQSVFSKNDFAYSLENLVKLGANLPPELIITPSKQFVLSERAPKVVFDYRQSLLVGAAVEQKLVALVEEWLNIHSSGLIERTFPSYIQRLQQGGFYSTKRGSSLPELSFYRVCIDKALQMTTPMEEFEANGKTKLNYAVIDAISKFFVILVKFHPERASLLSRILSVLSGILVYSATTKPFEFDQRPFQRFFSNFFVEFDVSPAGPTSDAQTLPLLMEISDILHDLRPTEVPVFVFSWFELVSNRYFMPKLAKEEQCWPALEQLLVDMLTFLQNLLGEEELSPPVDALYQGSLRVLLVLLHDFPEFLCEYHYSFCDVIPSSCVQMRNLVLSAFPRTMKLPDPFTPNLKVDLLPEIKEFPRIRTDYAIRIRTPKNVNLKTKLDSYLRTLEPAGFLTELVAAIRTPAAEEGGEDVYDVPLINAIVLYIGASALSPNSPKPSELAHQAPMDIFRYLAVTLDSAGRYVLFNSIANQLRYPNNHTHFFSCVLLYLFAEASQEVVQEQVTRVLVERLIGHRPHPWGLLITFVELLKNPRYKFWGRSFTRIAPEIERLFFQVGNSISSHRPAGVGETMQ